MPTNPLIWLTRLCSSLLVVFFVLGLDTAPCRGQIDGMQANGNLQSSNNSRLPNFSSRVLVKTTEVDMPVHEVWKLWTTSEGIARFFSSDSNVDLRINGNYDIYFGMTPDQEGRRGSQGCRILYFVDNELLLFDWNFPPEFPALRFGHAKTQVMIRLKGVDDGRTIVELAQFGWQCGEDWEKAYQYFDEGWGRILDKLKAVN